MTAWTALVPAAVAAIGAVAAIVADMSGLRRIALACTLAGAVGAATVAVIARPASGAAPAVLFTDGSRPGVMAVVALLAVIALAGGWRRWSAAPHGGQAAALSGLVLSASLAGVAASDLVTLTIALEAMALAAYGLVALAGDDASREAAMKYFVQGAVATGLLILALAVLFTRSGGTGAYATAWTGVSSVALPARAVVLGWALVAAVLAFKAGAFPMHSWAPDVYGSAEPPASALLTSVPKVAAVAVAVLLLVGGRVDAGSPLVAPGVFAVFAVGSIVVGNLAALRQRSLARMLAYSGVAQVGYAFTGLVVGFGGAAMLAIVTYAVAATGAFLAVEAVLEADPSWSGDVAGLAGLGRRRPWLAAAVSVLMLSLTGIPLFAGFIGKLYVFGAAVAAGWTWLAVVGVLGSVVSFGYYGRVMRAMYLLEPGQDPCPVEATRSPATAAVLATAALVVVLGCAPLAWGANAFLAFLGG